MTCINMYVYGHGGVQWVHDIIYKHGIVIHVDHQLRCYSTQLAAILTCSLKAMHWRLYAWGMVAEIAAHIE